MEGSGREMEGGLVCSLVVITEALSCFCQRAGDPLREEEAPNQCHEERASADLRGRER